MAASVLVIDELGALAEQVDVVLRRRFRVSRVTQLDAALESRHFDVALIAPGPKQAELCVKVREARVAEDVVVLASSPSLEDTVVAIRARASDFVPNGDDPEEVVTRINEVVDLSKLRKELGRLRTERPTATSFPDLIGDSSAMKHLRDLLERVATGGGSVLITGESGCGKELVARCLHGHGPRRVGAFVALCPSKPADLAAFEAFAQSRRSTLNGDSRAHAAPMAGGTVFIDDVAELSIEQQTNLLRLLQQRRARSAQDGLAGDRVIVGTRADLSSEVASGRFRQDLFQHLNATQVSLPPLRRRGRDVLLLAEHFIRRASTPLRPVRGLTPGAAKAILAHSWPGNVRELENCIGAAIANARYDHVTTADLPASVRGQVGPSSSDGATIMALSELERAHILHVLRSVNGNKALTSRRLGLDRKTLYRKLKAYGIDEELQGGSRSHSG
jgi:two-component system response regulator HydG